MFREKPCQTCGKVDCVCVMWTTWDGVIVVEQKGT